MAAELVRRGAPPRPAGSATAVGILESFPPVEGLVFGTTACGGSRSVGTLITQCVDSAAMRQWRSMGARTFAEARAYLTAATRSRVSFAAAVAHARERISRLELVSHPGRAAGTLECTTVPIVSQTLFEQWGGGPLAGGGGRAAFAGGGHF